VGFAAAVFRIQKRFGEILMVWEQHGIGVRQDDGLVELEEETSSGLDMEENEDLDLINDVLLDQANCS
jgi:hypothetical protein